MNREELIEAISTEANLTKAASDKAVKAFIEVVSNELANKGKVQIAAALLANLVLLARNAGLFRHFLGGESFDLPQFADALRHFFDLSVQISSFHSFSNQL